MKKAVIIPTGEEIKNGTVLDLNSPDVMQRILRLSPECEIKRVTPVVDEEEKIIKQIIIAKEEGAELVVLIGGSGGGHRFDKNLSKDYTHSALFSVLSEKQESLLYGKNGHLWCRLLCGYFKGALVINLPGPNAEAVAAMDAFLESYQKSPSGLKNINENMANAVKRCYEE